MVKNILFFKVGGEVSVWKHTVDLCLDWAKQYKGLHQSVFRFIPLVSSLLDGAWVVCNSDYLEGYILKIYNLYLCIDPQ